MDTATESESSEPDWLWIFNVGILVFMILFGSSMILLCSGMFTSRKCGVLMFLRITSLLYRMLFWIFSVFGTVCLSTSCQQYSRSLKVSAHVGLYALPLLWLLMLLESLMSSDFQYVSNQITVESVEQYVDDMSRVRPSVLWTVTCYHNERRIQHDTDEAMVRIVSHNETQVGWSLKVFFCLEG